MLLLQYDPATTELSFKEQALPPVTANFSEFELTSPLTLNAGTVTVNGFFSVSESGSLEITVGSIIEVL